MPLDRHGGRSWKRQWPLDKPHDNDDDDSIRCQYTKAQDSLIQFVVNLLQTCLYNMSTTYRPSGAWALPHMHVLITDR